MQVNINDLAILMVLVPVVTALVQVIKGFIYNSKWYPVVSLVIAIGLTFLSSEFLLGPLAWQLQLLGGLLVGLAASGLYSWGDTFTKRVA